MSIEFYFMLKKSSWGCAIRHCVAKYIWYCHKNTYFVWNAIKIRHFLYLVNYTLILPYQVHVMRVSSAVTPHFIQKEQRPIRNIFFGFPVTFPLFFVQHESTLHYLRNDPFFVLNKTKILCSDFRTIVYIELASLLLCKIWLFQHGFTFLV